MFSQNKTGFRGQITKQFIGIMVVIIIGVAVVIPVVQNVTTSANLTGTTKTLVDLMKYRFHKNTDFRLVTTVYSHCLNLSCSRFILGTN